MMMSTPSRLGCAEPPRRGGGGFTLVELLVVVAVIALLIGLLLPALSKAREQGRLMVCLNNMRTITMAAQSYAADNSDYWPVFPCKIRRESRAVLFHSWHYGGKTVSEYWRPFDNGEWMSLAQRPLNSYVAPEVPLVDSENQPRTEIVTFKCPSDPGTLQRGWSTTPGFNNPNVTSYDDVGTSYHMNVKWWYAALERERASPFANNEHVWEAYKTMFRIANFKRSSLFAWAYDQNMDFVAVAGQSHHGDHGGENRATTAFMDGHVRYLEVTAKLPETSEYTLILSRPVRAPNP